MDSGLGYRQGVANRLAARTEDGQSNAALAAELRDVLGERVRENDLERALYSRDGSIDGSAPAFVCLPRSTSEVARIVQACREIVLVLVARQVLERQHRDRGCETFSGVPWP